MTNMIRFLTVLAPLTGAFSIPSAGFAQSTGGNQAATSQTQTGNQQSGGVRQPSTNQDRNQQPMSSGIAPRQPFLSGSVRLSDGGIPPASVVIERVCNGVVRPEGYTDVRGNFSFFVGGQTAGLADASVATDPSSSTLGGGSQSRFSASGLTGCEIRANLPGFRSDSIILGFRGMLDNPQIGTIHIHRLANVDGSTFSITTALASKDARHAYEKGVAEAKKQRWPQAERDFTTALQSFPKYAVAWYELGRVYQEEKKFGEAKHAYEEAIKIDPKYINPYGQLAAISAVQQKWDDVVQYTSQLVTLNPFVAPEIYFYSAVANYNLHNMEAAETRAREAAQFDPQHKIPRISHLLALILAAKQDYKDAAENMRVYLRFNPKAPDAALVEKQLAEFEKAESEQRAKP